MEMILAIVAIIAVPVSTIITAVVTVALGRRSQREANEVARRNAEVSRETALTDRFSELVQAQAARIEVLEKRNEAAEHRLDELESADADNTIRISELTAENIRFARANRALTRYARKLLRVIATHVAELFASAIAPDPEDGEFIRFDSGESDDDPLTPSVE